MLGEPIPGEGPIATYGRLLAARHELNLGDHLIQLLQPEVTEGSQWRPLADMFARESELLADVVAAHKCAARAWNMHIAAALVLKAFSVQLVWPVLLPWATERRVPELTMANTWVRIEDGGRLRGLRLAAPRFAVLPQDPAAGHPDAVVLDDEATLLEWLDERVLTAAITRAVEVMRGRYRVSARLAWGNVAPTVNGLFQRLADALGKDQVYPSRQAFFARRPDLAQMLTHVPIDDGTPAGRLQPMRRVCCLIYKAGDGTFCGTCPLIPLTTRIARYEAYYRDEGWLPLTGADRARRDDRLLT